MKEAAGCDCLCRLCTNPVSLSFMYWDINKTLTYNALFNFIVGARGVGKTYGAKQFVIKDFIKNDRQFVYVRRYKEELKKMKTFFDDIMEAFPEHELKYDRGFFYIDGKACGCPLALSTAKVEKSTPFPRVATIIFDEFILDKGYHHYLPDEVTNFLELYSTVARDRDVRVFFLSNALTITNPYFLYFDLTIPYNKNNIKCENDILIEVIKDTEYSDHMKNTRFGKIIAGTEYGNYNMDNEFYRDNFDFIGKKSVTAKYLFAIKYKDTIFGVWLDLAQGCQVVSYDYDKTLPVIYSLTIDDHTPNTYLLKGQKPFLLEQFFKNYKMGLVRFESMNIKNVCQELIKMTL